MLIDGFTFNQHGISLKRKKEVIEEKTYTIGMLAKRSGLARSSLLYYDSIGLLKPSGRARNRYRLYSEEDVKKLDLICLYRQAGLSLKEIKKVLMFAESTLTKALLNRLDELAEEMKNIRQQQEFIITILKNDKDYHDRKMLDKKTWISILSSAGLSEEDMDQWHNEFERQAPDRHQEFLEFLCIPDDEISQIREYSRHLKKGSEQ